MIIRKILVLILMLSIIFPAISSSSTNKSMNITTSTDDETLESRLIEDFPYVGQDDDIHCAYATRTMCIKYLNDNVSFEDIIFHTGCAYSVGYPFKMPPSFSYEYMPMGGFLISQDIEDAYHLDQIYGMKTSLWYKEINKSTLNWKEYLSRVKENVSKDIPVTTSVHPLRLLSTKRFFEVPEIIWNYMSSQKGSGHSIVIIGYNDSNNTICYNDPAALFFGDTKKGTYVWMDQNDFLYAVNGTSVGFYLIKSTVKISEPIEEKLAFNISHERNIERLKGNSSRYGNVTDNDSKYDINYKFGINAIDELIEIYNNKSERKYIVKYFNHKSFNYKINKLTGKFSLLLFRAPYRIEELLTQDWFEKIGIDRKIVADYLRNNSHLSDRCIFDADLLDKEAEKWFELSSVYSKFMKRGPILNKLLAPILINKMAIILEEIKIIEQAIINGPNES